MKYLCCLSLLAILGLAAATGLKAEDRAELEEGLSQARTLAENGHPEIASMMLEELATREGAHYEVRLLQGIVEAQLGNTESARRIFDELLAIHPERPELYNNLAALAARENDLAAAIAHLERGVTHQQAAYVASLENLKRLYAAELGRDGGSTAGDAPELSFLDAAAKPLAGIANAAGDGLMRVEEPVASAVAEPATSTVPTPTAPESPMPEPPMPTASESPMPTAPEPPPMPEPPRPTAPEPPMDPAPDSADTPPRVTVAMPVAAPAPDDGETLDVERRIRLTIDGWAKAWSAQRVADYLAYYADDFRPADGSSRADWAELRRGRLLAPSTIRVWVTTLEITIEGPERARARFVQHYESDTYGDVVTKVLELRREDGDWRILEERVEV